MRLGRSENFSYVLILEAGMAEPCVYTADIAHKPDTNYISYDIRLDRTVRFDRHFEFYV